jgi:flagellar motor switch protein FliG
MTDVKERKKIRGIEKAAILLLSLPEEYVSPLIARLDPDEIKEISQAMVNLGTIKAHLVETLFIEFSGEISSTSTLVGSVESTEKFLLRVLGKDKASAIIEEIRGPAGRTVWDKLSNVNEELLASYLKNEYPQTIAVILTRIKHQNAAKIIAALPEAIATEVLLRLLRMEPVKKEIIDDIESNLRLEFMNNIIRDVKKDNHQVIAEIFNHLDRSHEKIFMERLERLNKESAERVRSLMFTFDNLLELDSNSMQQLIRSLDKGKIALALKGANETMRNAFFKNMSTRAAKLLDEEIQIMGMVRLREVEEAQSYIIEIAKSLAEEGVIFINSSKEEGDRLIA